MPPPVTMIQDLEELEGSHPPHGMAPVDPGGMNMAKYLRGYHQPHTDSGMYEPQPSYEPQFQPQFQPQQIPSPQYNCIDIANHIQNCPICSKFYNTDKTIYIVIIIFLCFICLLLMKRILNV